ncbi:hypothetical protein [Actinomycetospora straminea]|nr:hypothetical protein [Actinomycetospora straminea]MDD7936719.1 hypothetical protein [Actinomycetospora straminea]
MTSTDDSSSDPADGDPGADRAAPGREGRDAIGQLFAAALDGDTRAAAALHLLGGLDHTDDTAHRASFALLGAGHDSARHDSARHDSARDDCAEPIPPDVLAGIDQALAAARDHHAQRAVARRLH